MPIIKISSVCSYSFFHSVNSCSNFRHAAEKELFSILKNSIYKVNPQTAAFTFVCSMANSSMESYGAAASFGAHAIMTEVMPNVFRPNGDGKNDLFSFTRCEQVLKTTIYNRWGNEVFNTEIQNNFWNGRTTGGTECSEGAYFYVIVTEERRYKGSVQLVR